MKEYCLKVEIAQQILSDHHASYAACSACLAERVGFEPTVGRFHRGFEE
jgi:hypothetical protein